MGKKGIIAVIPKEFNEQTSPFEAGLRRKGYSRIPGTSRMILPAKALSGKYITGLDPDAAYIGRIKDPMEQKLEVERVNKTREWLQEELQIDLSPRSDYYNFAKKQGDHDEIHVSPVKLSDGDNIYNLDDPKHALTFAWIRVHPQVATSYEAYERGDFGPDVQYYVKEEEVETEITYKKKTAINKAIVKFENMSLPKRKKVARMMGLFVGDDTREEQVYNQVDTVLKSSEVKTGEHRGSDPVELFNRFADMQDELLYAKDLVNQAITFNVYRISKGGRIEEGGVEIAKNKDELVEFLLTDNKELIGLEEILKRKKAML